MGEPPTQRFRFSISIAVGRSLDIVGSISNSTLVTPCWKLALCSQECFDTRVRDFQRLNYKWQNLEMVCLDIYMGMLTRQQ